MSAQRPNLFRYGRKELSQDAMICWLLDWANECHANADNEAERHLHECGQRFARALFAKHGRAGPGEIRKVEIGQQVSGIDVLAWVNREYALLIEDKTDTDAHGNQLERYHEQVLEVEIEAGKKRTSPEKLFPVFFKTGNMSACKGESIEAIDLDPPYRVFGRRDFLDAMKGYDRRSSPILTDFICFMEEREADFESWKHKSPKDWFGDAWQGFYRRLEEELDRADWNYVPNPTGGFFGLWWYFKDHDNGDTVYLQTEEEKLCFKISVREDVNRGERRWHWHEGIVKAGKSTGMDIDRPKRFGSGKHMTVAVLNGDWRRTGDDGRLNLETSVQVLKDAQRVVDEAMKG